LDRIILTLLSRMFHPPSFSCLAPRPTDISATILLQLIFFDGFLLPASYIPISRC
jgi:hypothetical protein